MKKKQWRN